MTVVGQAMVRSKVSQEVGLTVVGQAMARSKVSQEVGLTVVGRAMVRSKVSQEVGMTVVGRAMARSMVGQLLSELRQMDVDTNLKGQSCTDIFATSCNYLPLYGS